MCEVKCSSCSSKFGPLKKRPIVGTCGHTVCFRCTKKETCRICAQENAFSLSSPSNFALLQQIEHMEKKIERKTSDNEETLKLMDEDEDSSEVIECQICFANYDLENNHPVVGVCGHTVCFLCSLQFMDDICPHCRTEQAFQDAPRNFALIDIIERLWVPPREDLLYEFDRTPVPSMTEKKSKRKRFRNFVRRCWDSVTRRNRSN